MDGFTQFPKLHRTSFVIDPGAKDISRTLGTVIATLIPQVLAQQRVIASVRSLVLNQVVNVLATKRMRK